MQRRWASKLKLESRYRSKSEERFAKHLEDTGVPFEYEKEKIRYRIEKDAFYRPDFFLKNGDLLIEYKGQFTPADRMKHLRIKEQHPDRDIRFVFDNSRRKLSSTSSTTYGMWCEKHGFQYADKFLPKEWIT